MRIAIVGFGKMGHMIKSLAEKRGNHIVLTADPYAEDADVKSGDASKVAEAIKNSSAEGIIEFTNPDVVLNNIKTFLPLGLPLVVGTTGWMTHLPEVKEQASSSKGSLFYAANFSVGVNLFYKIVEEAASLISAYDEYDSAVWEAHHNTKVDSPSGTALEIARRMMAKMPEKTEIVSGNFQGKPAKNQLQVASTRVGSVPGTHTVFFDSSADTIELTHTARSREGLAMGAVRACEWLCSGISSGKLSKGSVYTMEDLLGGK
ncbi:MAG: 4-hydroxy-tetrahydrodipicolinate reductase [Treponemataceae bacterium]|nr:4-hydroxy-tetrahydrodipicolinate reductase [Treponemataceae bacterium]